MRVPRRASSLMVAWFVVVVIGERSQYWRHAAVVPGAASSLGHNRRMIGNRLPSRLRSAETKEAHQAIPSLGLHTQFIRCGGGFFRQGCVLARHVIHPHYGSRSAPTFCDCPVNGVAIRRGSDLAWPYNGPCPPS